MAIIILIQLVDIIETFFVWMIIINMILSYVMDPYHPIRRTIDSILAPLLNPIRRVVPLVGMFDFSPLVLIILLQVASTLIKSFLRAL
jgi:YggT family protein